MDRIALLARATLRARWASLIVAGLLAGVIGKAIPPRAAGVPYVKER